MTSQTTCTHETTRQIGLDRCFSGSVSAWEENLAAHGSITCDVECVRCGARRVENHNGRHAEYGPWGPSREERRADADRLRRRAQQYQDERPVPTTVTRDDGTEVTVLIDPDGYLLVVGPHTSAEEPSIAQASGLLEAAARVRRAVMDAESAREAI